VGSLSVHGGRAVHSSSAAGLRPPEVSPRKGKVALLQTHQPARTTHSLKTTRDYVHIIDAYSQLGSYRATAELCGTSDKTVKRAVERQQAGGPWSRRHRALRPNTDSVSSVIAQRVKDTDGRITAKRLLPVARAAGYQGSARNFRRAVAAAKADWRRTRRGYRPWVPNPGQRLVIDWGDAAGGLQMFCAVLAWCALPLRALCHRRNPAHHTGPARRVLRGIGGGTRRRAQRPYGLPEERHRRQLGGAPPRLPALRRSLWVQARLL
jgi:hypothetical protein